jgi:uncharacterized protein YbjT (DUF2867 family)
MRITVFGATGPTGRRVVEQALAAGHRVVAVARRPEDVPAREGLTVVAADATDPQAVDAAVAGSDAVLSALGARPSRRPVAVYSEGVRNIVAAMGRHGVRRLVVVSSSVLDPAWRPSGEFFFNHVLDPYVNRVIARTAHQDMRRMEALVRASGLDWTIVRPSGLFDHPEVTAHRLAENSADGLYTARADLAATMLGQLADDRYVRRAVGVITTEVRPGLVGLLRSEAARKR